MSSSSRNTTPDLISIVDRTYPHSHMLTDLFTQGLEFLRAAQQARRLVLTREGDVHDLGPDFQVRTAALALLVKVAVAGKTALVAKPAEKTLYLHEWRRYFEEAVRRGDLPENPNWPH